MRRKTLYFTAPGQVEIIEESIPEPGSDEVYIETLCSAISAGTEMLIYQGSFPQDLEADSVISSLRSSFKYPLAYGYASVGVVQELGKNVDPYWRDRQVFSFQPHTSHYVCRVESLIPVPASLSPEAACFFPNMETAVNLVQDGAPLLDERVLVLGQGVVGLLTAALLAQFPLEALVTVDQFDRRRQASTVEGQRSKVAGFRSLDPGVTDFHKQAFDTLKHGADLAFELSGNPAALNDAIALTAFSGRIVIGSWYGQKSGEVNLGGSFHRSRIRMFSSQVSTLAPELSGRWDKARRFDAAWRALEWIRPEKWITHRFALGQAPEAYHLLNEHPQDTIQLLLDYKQ